MEGEKHSPWRYVIIAAVLAGIYVLYKEFFPEIDLQQLLHDFSDTLGKWTYVIVGLLAFLETGAFVGLVAPGETFVLIAGAVAGQGVTSIVLTIAIVWFCAWLGDTTSFFIGRRLGRDFVLKHGPKVPIVPITHERFESVEKFFAEHGGKTILVGRFIGLVRALAPFIAGSSGMRYRAFVPYSILGTGLWAAAFSLLGYALSQSLDKAGKIAGTGALIFGTLVAIIVGSIVISRYLREPENRAKLAARIEGIPVVRRLLPQIRFTWRRITPGNLGLEFTTLMAVLAVALFVLVGYGMVVGGDPGPTPGDSQAIDIVNSIRTDWLTSVAKVVTALGSSVVLIPLTLVVAGVLAWRRRWPEFWVLVGGVVIMLIAVPVIKEIVGRPRPAGMALVSAPDESYPSGHATHSVFYTWLALTVTLRVRPGWSYGTALLIGGIALTVAIGLSRFYLGVHYLSDVSGGWALGVSAFTICAAVAMVATHIRQNHVT
jgi:membrane protein DedA with SNARE-associated domain/membrane-associated phospholipid phosphatase